MSEERADPVWRDTAALGPVLDPAVYRFCQVAPGAALPALEQAAAVVQEAEGTTLVLPADHPAVAGLRTTFTCQRISLAAETALDATGIMAGVAARLAEAGLACNPMAGYCHDHLYVPAARAAEALAVLQAPVQAWALLADWFGPLDGHGMATQQAQRRWFMGGPAFDAHLAARWGALHAQVLAGAEPEGWRTNACGRLALVLLLDQLSRNLGRGTAAAFAGDARALALADEAVAAGDDRLFGTDRAAFLYLPFEHAEAPDAQARAVALFEGLLARAPEAGREAAQSWLAHAREHAAIVEAFGRFPHRNEVLGRTDTPAEAAWLVDNHGRFGQ